MRQPQIHKHQVCDRCGGRFGMVTHRWWGKKFCKRACKDAYLREASFDSRMIGRWIRVTGLSRNTLALRPPELPWRDSEHLTEMTRQVALVGKPHGTRNLRQ
jgi:hypothetical protein